MNILIIGSGGREHAIAWKLSQSPKLDKLFVAPGNPGIAAVATNVAIAMDDFAGLGVFVKENKIDIMVVGPEAPLVNGIRDYFSTPEYSFLTVIGPDKIGAQLEGSKDFSKQFMQKYNIPTAAYRTFVASQLEEGLAYLKTQTIPIVLKADGLAAGKGVIIAEDLKTAEDTLKEMLVDKKFGDASTKVVIEQFLDGIELSMFAVTDGKNYVLLPEAKDYKRIGEGDKGLNTGGMGAVSPVPFATEVFKKKIEDTIIKPTVDGLVKEGINYVGFIFFGLIKVGEEPFVIEYNARMGDPETEVVIPRLKSDLYDIFAAVRTQSLDKVRVEFIDESATTIMLVSGGYPEDFEKGFSITGIENVKDALVFHAGTSLKDGNLVNTGGRVLALTAFGKDIPTALTKSNAAAKNIVWNNRYYRTDIGLDLLK